MTPFFSIIIPLYNSGKTLQKSLDSITCQSFKNIELIFVDGCSTDDTGLMLNKFINLSNFPIRLISEPDRGIYDAMNKGLDIATGSWLYFMGGDDRFFSDTVLQEVYEAIKSAPTDIVYGNVIGESSGVVYADDTINKVLSRGIHHQSVFYKSSVFNYTGKYDLRFRIAADYHLTLKLFCERGIKIRYINTTIAVFGEGGFSSTVFDYYFFSYHYKFLMEQNAINKVDDPEKLLKESIYCCMQLARTKRHIGFAWQNIIFYVGRVKMPIEKRMKILAQMMYWNLKF